MWHEVSSMSWCKYLCNHLFKRWSSSSKRHCSHSSITQMDLNRHHRIPSWAALTPWLRQKSLCLLNVSQIAWIEDDMRAISPTSGTFKQQETMFCPKIIKARNQKLSIVSKTNRRVHFWLRQIRISPWHDLLLRSPPGFCHPASSVTEVTHLTRLGCVAWSAPQWASVPGPAASSL